MLNRRSSLSLFLVLPVVAILAGCAEPLVRPAPRFTLGQSVDFEQMNFNFTSVETTSSFTNFVNQRTVASDTFVIVDVTMINKLNRPLEYNFQPIYRLIDSAGATYELDAVNTMQINMGKSGRPTMGLNINPNVKVRQQLVFEVPKQKYDLQVLMPTSAKVGFNGSIIKSGPYFLLDISSSKIKTDLSQQSKT